MHRVRLTDIKGRGTNSGTILPVLRLIRVYIIASVLEFQREEEEKGGNSSRCWKEGTERKAGVKAPIMCIVENHLWTARTLGQSKPTCLDTDVTSVYVISDDGQSP